MIGDLMDEWPIFVDEVGKKVQLVTDDLFSVREGNHLKANRHYAPLFTEPHRFPAIHPPSPRMMYKPRSVLGFRQYPVN